MQNITEIFRTYGPEYIERFEDDMPSGHHKALQAIIQCRTQVYGMTIYKCQGCGQIHHVFRSCGNRHCPQCQHHKTRQWLEKQLDRQVPCPHFLITFTVPEELRLFIRSHQKEGYEALFHASSEALKTLTKTLVSSGPIFPASPASSIPGEGSCSSTPTSITSCPGEDYQRTVPNGLLQEPTSMSPSRRSHQSSAQSSKSI